jgi:DNA-binding CsgD family transcriptional regulator
MAGQLDITINTVRNHVRNIYAKLGVHTKSEAVLKAFKRGLLS